MCSIEEGFFDFCSEGGGADCGEWDMMHKPDPPVRFRSGGEDVDCAGKGTRGNGDIRVEDPENVMFGVAVRAYEVIDLRVYSDHFLACSVCQSTTRGET